ncbi:hypothetical protein D3C81_2199910 [compost metagenome]
MVSSEAAGQLIALIPHANTVDVEGAGHMVAGDRNDVFNGAIRTFIDSLDSPASQQVG